jgi:hypothetical protein
VIDIDLDKMVNGYLQCALFTGVDEDDEPLDYTYTVDDFEESAVELACKTCAQFVLDNRADVEFILNPGIPATPTFNEDIGMDLWYTQNRHGTGFWEHGYGKQGERFTAYCDTLPERNVFAPESDEYENGATLVIE